MNKTPWQEINPKAKYAWRKFYTEHQPGKPTYIKAEIKNRAGKIIKRFQEEYKHTEDGSIERIFQRVYEFLETLPDLTWESPKEIYVYDEYLLKDKFVKF